MRLVRVTALAYATSILAASAIPESPRPDALELSDDLPEWQPPADVVALEPRQYELEDSILSALLAQVEFEHMLINATLRRFPEPMDPVRRKFVTNLIGINFARMTRFILTANAYLEDKTPADILALEAAEDCGAFCISHKMNGVIKEVGQAGRTSLLKLGLTEVGKYIQPAFLALSGTVLAVNTIVGGALVVVSGLVNGLSLAISAGIAYLGKLASDDQRERAGGPMGPKTMQLGKVLMVLLRIVGHQREE